MGWQIITSSNLWKEVVYNKYIHPLSIPEWIRSPSHNPMGVSNIWKAITHSIDIIKQGLAWKVWDGSQIRIGSDAWARTGNAHILPREMRQELMAMGISQLAHILMEGQREWPNMQWWDFEHVGINRRWGREWMRFMGALEEANIWISTKEDKLIWAKDPTGIYSLKVGFTAIMETRTMGVIKWWWRFIWKLKVP